MRSLAWRAGLAACVLVLGEPALAPALAQEPPPLLTYGITGRVTAQGNDNPTNLLARRPIQELVLRAAANGVTAAEAEAALTSADATLADLVRTALLRDSGGRYVVAFPLITASDRARIDTVIEPYAQSLASAVLARRARFDQLFSRYDLAGVDRRLVAYALIECVGLDWDGLDVTAERGYRTPTPVHPNGDRFSLWAREQGPNVSYRGLYWGSHNSERNDVIWLTTFGDHEAIPRAGFPDATNEINGAITRSRLPAESSRAVRGFLTPRVDAMLDNSARAMVLLRSGPMTTAHIAQGLSLDEVEAGRLLAVLASFKYVRAEGDYWAASVPVFTARDREMIAAVRAETRQIMTRWLARNSARLRRDLGDLSSLRAGVSYEQMFTEIWHYLFGLANSKLSASGFAHDPYAADAPWIGFAPFVWESSLDLYD